MVLRVVMVAHSAGDGGAARGLQRVFHALGTEIPRDRLHVTHRVVGGVPSAADPMSGVVAGLPGGFARIRRQLSFRRDRLREARPFTPALRAIHSTANVWTGLGRELQQGPADIITLGWLGSGTISIEEIGALTKPIVWRMPDMWAFSGAEHITEGSRYREGYFADNRPAGESGWDKNRDTWERKVRAWKVPHHVVTPSHWLAERVRDSALMHEWPVTVIPNPLDLEFWSPARPGSPNPQESAQDDNGLDSTKPIVLFVAEGGTKTRNKGFDLLHEALGYLAASRIPGDPSRDFQLVVVGNSSPALDVVHGFAVYDAGRVRDDSRLRALYRRASLVVVPSRIESFGQVAAESQACGTPVVAFRTGGLVDIVKDGLTGRLAEPFDPRSLATTIDWVLADATRQALLSDGARERMEGLVSERSIAHAYFNLYASMVRDR